MYAMLAGAPPFAGEASELLERHLSEPPVPLRDRRTDIPAQLEALVAQLLAKSPDARPTNALEVKSRLLAVDADPPAAAMTPSLATLGTEQAAAPPTVTQRRAAFLGRAPVDEADPPAANVRPRPRPRPRATRVNRRAAALGLIALAAILTLVVATSRSTPVDRPDARAVRGALLGGAASPSVAAPPAIQPSTFTQSNRPTQPGAAVAQSSPVPVDRVVALRLSIQQQVNTGNLNPDKASDLYKKVDEIARAINVGDTEEAEKKIKELRDKFTTLLDEGQLSPGGHDTLIRHLDLVAASLA
jgi:serine/threonine-protein kinase